MSGLLVRPESLRQGFWGSSGPHAGKLIMTVFAGSPSLTLEQIKDELFNGRDLSKRATVSARNGYYRKFVRHTVLTEDFFEQLCG
jgi:hypothetical protein